MLDSLPAPADIAQGIANGQQADQAQVDKAAAQAAVQRAQNVAAEAAGAYDELAAARDKIDSALKEAGYGGAARYEIDERGLVVHIVADAVLFDAEEAVLRPKGRAILDAVAPTLTGLPNMLRVEGHANHLPVTRGGKWPSNWELSAYRATTVLTYLVARRRPGAAHVRRRLRVHPAAGADHRSRGDHREPPGRHRRPVQRFGGGERPPAGDRRRTSRSHPMSTKEKATETDEAPAKGGKKKLLLIVLVLLLAAGGAAYFFLFSGARRRPRSRCRAAPTSCSTRSR